MLKKRNGELDALRFVFMMVVLLLHFGTGLFPYGNIGVEFFFTLSGLLMARHAEKWERQSNGGGRDLTRIADETWVFMKGKLGAFYKFYLVAFVFNVVVRYLIIQRISFKTFAFALMKSIPTVTLSFFAFSGNSTSYLINASWYLSALLVAMFILYPILLRNYRFAVKIVFPILTVFLLGYEQTTNQDISIWGQWSGLTYFGILRAAAEISFGATLYYISTVITGNEAFMKRAEHPILRTLFTLAKVLCYGIVILYAHKKGLGFKFDRSFQLHALFFCGIGILLSFSGLGWTIPDCRLTRYLGRISVPIYVFHKLLRATWLNYLGVEKVSVRHTYFLVVACVIGSVVMMYITELIFKWCKKLFRPARKEEQSA